LLLIGVLIALKSDQGPLAPVGSTSGSAVKAFTFG
jgi:hypothetical protein